MPSVNETLKPFKITLTEQDGWKRYDASSENINWSSDNAYETFKASHVSDCAVWLEDVLDVGTGSVKDWSPKKGPAFTEEQVDLVCNALMDHGAVHDDLEPLHQLILDAITWMYEAAYLPNDSDVEYALEQAQEATVDTVQLDEDVWQPLLRRHSEEDIIREIADAVTYSRPESGWARSLVLEPRKINIVKKMVGVIRRSCRVGDITKNQALHALGGDLQSIFDDVEHHFWDLLEKQMQTIDIDNRTDWKVNWRAKLEDKDAVRYATQGVHRFINEKRREGESNA